MKIIGYGGEMQGILVTLFIFITIVPYIDSIFIFCVFLANVYLNGVLKLLHHDPRPFFVVDEIKAIMCNKSYGNPSGHSMYFTSVLPCLVVVLLEMINRNCRMTLRAKIYTSIILSISGLFIILSILGRVYLGVHSLDQILYGSLMGTSICLYFLFVARRPITQYFSQFIEEKCTKSQFIMQLLIMLLIMGIFIFIAILAYTVNVFTFDDPEAWKQAIITKCNLKESDFNENSRSCREALMNTIAATGSFGGLFGAIFFSHFHSAPINEIDFLPFWKTICRFLVNVVICAPVGLLLLIPRSSPFIIVLIFSAFLADFIICFLLFSVNRYLLLKCSLLKLAESPPRKEYKNLKNNINNL